MTHVPALREALQDAAERRYGKRRVGWIVLRRGGLSLTALAAFAAVAALVYTLDSGPEPTPLADERPGPLPGAAGAIAPHATRVTRLHAAGPPRIVRPGLLSPQAAAEAFAAEGGGASGRLERAWKTPGMHGHVFLLRKGTDWCLSVADPFGDSPGDRGVACSSDATFSSRLGVSVTVGNTYAAVIPDGGRAPTFRRPDGTKNTLAVADGGLIAIADVADGSAITLHAADGADRVNRIRVGLRLEYECSDGRVFKLTARVPGFDPCAPPLPNPSSTPLPQDPDSGASDPR